MNQYHNSDAAKKFEYFKALYQKKQYDPIETPSVLKLVGDLTNKTIIDYGCGSGHYSRKLAKLAQHVVGVDLSPHMIELAKQINENENISNIDYYAHDCSEILNLGEFDMVFSSYFLNYARSAEHLKKMFQSMFASLKSKQTCCGIMPNSHINFEDFHYLRKYGYEFIRDENADDGAIHRQRFYETAVGTSECLYEVQFYYIKPSTFEQVVKDVGFANFKWINVSLSDDFKHLAEHFADYLKYPASIMFSAQKP